MSDQQPNKINPQEVLKARRLLWYDGDLQWKLHRTQKEIYEFIKNNSNKIIVVSCSRRLGKTYLLLTMAIEQCLAKSNTIVKFLSPEVKMIRKILRPLMNELLRDCPLELRPTFKFNENIYRFPNKSEIQLGGTDSGNAESLRGGSSNICIIDEAGFCSDLDYIVKQILVPTTTTTGGKIILLSTPPRTADHDYLNFAKQAEFKGAFIRKTIYDNPLITSDMLKDILEAVGGEESVEFQREYLCLHLLKDEDKVLPEFNEGYKKNYVLDWRRPAFYDAYASMDIGFKDLTVVLFAYVDYRNAKLVIEDEYVINGPKMTTPNLAQAIKDYEARLWRNPITEDIAKPYKRVSDNNLIFINDLQVHHNLTFLPTAKDDKMSAVNNVRMFLQQGRIIINPRCKILIRHMDNGTWDLNRKSFDRSPDNGHYDAIDALVYLIRNIDMYRNPFPANYDLVNSGGDLFEYRPAEDQNKTRQFLKDIFTVKKISKR